MKEISLRQATVYNLISKYGIMTVQLGITMILARLILPEAHGVVSILTVIITFFSLFADMGLGISIIQHPEMEKEAHYQLFTFSIIVGICLLTAMCLISYPLSLIYNNPEYLKLGPIVSVVALFTSMNTVPNAILCRNKRFDIIAIRTIISTFASGIIAVLLAFKGFGVYALVAQSICSSVLLFVMNFVSHPLKIKKFIPINILKLLGKYSLFQLLFNFMNYFTRNLDNLVIGAKMGDAPLGYYNKAYTLSLYPNYMFTSVITGVLHPFIRDYKYDFDVLYKKMVDILKPLSLIGLFVMIEFYWCSSEIVFIMFGENWTLSAVCFKALSISIWAQVLSSVAGSIFLGIERTDQTFKCGVINLAMIIISLVVGIYSNSLEIVSLAIAITYNIMFLITYYILVVQTMRFSFLSFLKNFIYEIVCAGFFIFVINFIPIDYENVWMSLIFKTFICGIYFVLFLFITNQYNIIRNLFRLIRKDKNKRF